MFKFNTGDHVSFAYGSVFSPSKTGMFEAVVNGGKIIARKGCGSSGGPEYRVDGFSGWWPEEYLVLISRGPENLHCCNESSEPIKRYYLIETTNNEYNSSYKKICDTLEEAKKEVPNYADWWCNKGTCSICEVDENFTVYTEYKFVNGYPAGIKVWREV